MKRMMTLLVGIVLAGCPVIQGTQVTKSIKGQALIPEKWAQGLQTKAFICIPVPKGFRISLDSPQGKSLQQGEILDDHGHYQITLTTGAGTYGLVTVRSPQNQAIVSAFTSLKERENLLVTPDTTVLAIMGKAALADGKSPEKVLAEVGNDIAFLEATSAALMENAQTGQILDLSIEGRRSSDLLGFLPTAQQAQDAVDFAPLEQGVASIITGISLNKSAITLDAMPSLGITEPGFQVSTFLEATVQSKAPHHGVKWTSSNPDLVTVENGVVRTVRGATAGNAIVTATAIDDPSHKASTAVTVIQRGKISLEAE